MATKYSEIKFEDLFIVSILSLILGIALSVPSMLIAAHPKKDDPDGTYAGEPKIQAVLEDLSCLDDGRYVVAYESDEGKVFDTVPGDRMRIEVTGKSTVSKYYPDGEDKLPAYLVEITEQQESNLGEHRTIAPK